MVVLSSIEILVHIFFILIGTGKADTTYCEQSNWLISQQSLIKKAWTSHLSFCLFHTNCWFLPLLQMQNTSTSSAPDDILLKNTYTGCSEQQRGEKVSWIG